MELFYSSSRPGIVVHVNFAGCLSWCPATGGITEIVRQRWNFSPGGSTTEFEDYAVNLENVSALELSIQPDISGADQVATLDSWRVGQFQNGISG